MKYEGYYVTFNKSVECLKDISRIDIHHKANILRRSHQSYSNHASGWITRITSQPFGNLIYEIITLGSS